VSTVQVLGSEARTASVTAEASTRGEKGAVVVVDVTAVAATPSITVTIRGKDGSGETWDILASTAITTVSTTVLKVYPGLTAAANTVANDVLPRQWEVAVVAADADEITYSVFAHLIP